MYVDISHVSFSYSLSFLYSSSFKLLKHLYKGIQIYNVN